MRSCDLIRHFADDIYLAGLLLQWVLDRVNTRLCQGYDKTDWVCEHEHIEPGELVMYIASLHAFVGDRYKLEAIASNKLGEL